MNTHAFHTPSVVTKQLKLNTVGDRQKVRISSNFLPLMGFEPGQRIITVPSMDGGFTVRVANDGPLQVHSRQYKRTRANNPLEAVVEFASKSLLKSTFPPGTERFHVQMRHGDLRVRPIANRVFNIRKRYQGHDPLRALVALTGGVDIHCLAKAGIHTDIVLEYRPDEARDISAGRTLTEVNALNTLRNGTPRVLINEDIYDLDPMRLKALVGEGDPVGIMHLSLQCDDFSTAKSASLKQKSLDDNSSTLDMVYPALRAIETLEPPMVVVENVRGFQTSHAGQIMCSMLRRFGYHISEQVLNGRDYGGVQNRTRYYLVASMFPGFTGPTPSPRNEASIWPTIEKHLADCTDVTDTASIAARETTGRGAPYLTRESTFCPTVMKSQSRGVKDAVYIQDGGRVLKPSEGLIKELMSIPEDFSVDWMAKEQATEVLGQSLDYAMHHRLMVCVREHLLENLGDRPILTARSSIGSLF